MYECTFWMGVTSYFFSLSFFCVRAEVNQIVSYDMQILQISYSIPRKTQSNFIGYGVVFRFLHVSTKLTRICYNSTRTRTQISFNNCGFPHRARERESDKMRNQFHYPDLQHTSQSCQCLIFKQPKHLPNICVCISKSCGVSVFLARVVAFTIAATEALNFDAAKIKESEEKLLSTHAYQFL